MLVSMSSLYDIAIVGGGIIGIATARALSMRRSLSIIVIEAEQHLASHQTGHNSGVIHSGLYYKPNSMKARLCVEGCREMYRFARERGLAFERCGKIVVATSERELKALEVLEARGRANGLQGLKKLGLETLREYEPHVSGLGGLWVPQTGIIDFIKVTRAFADDVRTAGHDIETGTRLYHMRRRGEVLELETTRGIRRCRLLINCGGLQSDRVARMCGVEPRLRIIPFRGEYYTLATARRHLVRHLIYPVPDARYPFLGVHFTRTIDGGVEAGPNAVLVFKREGYRKWRCSLRDTMSIFSYLGFWRMARMHWRAGLGEFSRSVSKRAFLRSLQKLVPPLELDDLRPGGAGVRAQAVESSGGLVDDFRIIEEDRMIHVLNAPSPAATASICIGRHIADIACKRFGVT